MASDVTAWEDKSGKTYANLLGETSSQDAYAILLVKTSSIGRLRLDESDLVGLNRIWCDLGGSGQIPSCNWKLGIPEGKLQITWKFNQQVGSLEIPKESLSSVGICFQMLEIWKPRKKVGN